MSRHIDGCRGPRAALGGAIRIVRGVTRLAIIAAFLLGLVAIAVGRSGRVDRSEVRGEAEVPVRVGFLVGGYPLRQDRFFDARTGVPVPVELPGAGALWNSGWAPWRDGQGRGQVVGRWSCSAGGGTRRNELVRLSQPDGAVLDRLPLEDLPHWAGAPCWFPDRTSRVLLAGGDCLLYRVDFDAARGPRLRPLSWHLEGPTPTLVRMDDLSWPATARLGGNLLVSLCLRSDWTPRPSRDEWRLWWLRIDGAATEVVAGGPIVVRGQSGAYNVNERFATLSPVAPHQLAWLEYESARFQAPCRLRIAPVEIDAATRAPSVRRASARMLDANCAPVAPAFSADGQHLVYMPATEDSASPRLRRLALDEVDVTPRSTRITHDDGGDSEPRIVSLSASLAQESRLVTRLMARP